MFIYLFKGVNLVNDVNDIHTNKTRLPKLPPEVTFMLKRFYASPARGPKVTWYSFTIFFLK